MVSFNDPIQQEVWTTVRAMNDAWSKGNPDDLANFFHPDIVIITPTESERLEGRAACIAPWKNFCKMAQIQRWEEQDPVVRVHGNAAAVVYSYVMLFDLGGGTTRTDGRDMFFFVKEGGKWQVIAHQFSRHPIG